MPRIMWAETWQWSIHWPTELGTMSTAMLLDGSSCVTSVRRPYSSTVAAWKCGVWRPV
jgi:hypothetical protein